jgi:threonine dehydrogenase-like Zn-dependent dehydrogenase
MLGVQRDGAFAEFVAIHSQNAVADHALSPRQLAYAEPVCAALAVCEPLRELSAGASLELAIVGCNRIATLTALVVQWCTGITPAVLSSSAVAQTETDRYDLIIESAAAEDVLAHAVRVLRPGGTLILKSRPSGPVALNYRAIVQKELQMRGAHYGDFLNALQWIASHQAAVEPLLGPVFALTDFEQAFAHDGHGEANKCFLAADTRLAESW